ncbi:MAG: DUF3299 domain-containing protein [Candidatus Hydrogenedentes bacterium]|nr:DUF3299 domain-containing protein [Candidatus Hydrogenedentota bacterium]
MRTRVVRDLGTIAGIIVILAGVVGLNIYYRLDSLKTKYDRIRRGVEHQRKASGMELLDWELLRKTKGSLSSGPRFDPELVKWAKQGRSSNLMGFMTPIDQFKDATHFMLLPLPIECYFCQMPPVRDVMLVRMTEGEVVQMAPEPVLVTGGLSLHEGPKQKFFYSMADSNLQAGESGQKLSIKSFAREHREQGYKEGAKLMQDAGGGHQPQAAPEAEMLPAITDGPDAAPSAGDSAPANGQ